VSATNRGPFASPLDEWTAARAELAAIEATEHPDVIDIHGRAWTWIPGPGDLYRHDCMAWPLEAVTSPNVRLPLPYLAGDPNYSTLCGVCRQNWSA
jgi:hypothetical protein